jgi:hypothetical protein
VRHDGEVRGVDTYRVQQQDLRSGHSSGTSLFDRRRLARRLGRKVFVIEPENPDHHILLVGTQDPVDLVRISLHDPVDPVDPGSRRTAYQLGQRRTWRTRVTDLPLHNRSER